MNVTLISPYLSIYSFGIRILSASLKKYSHNVKIIFLPKDFWNRYEDKILNEVVELSKGTDLIGISLMTNLFDNAVQITQRLKRDLNIPILWGGIHPTVRPQECLDYADMVCIGEGEESLVELVRKMEDGQDYNNVQGIWLKDKGNIITNKIRPLIQDLDSIPFQDYDYEAHYILDGKCIHKMSEGLLKKYSEGKYMTISTRGCPFSCSYCCNNALNKIYLNQKPIRKRSIDNVIKELMQVKIRLPIMECIYFDDDAFFLYSIEEIKEFSKKYKQNIELPLIVTGATPSTLTREKLSLLVDAGLKYVRMGIETGSERTKRLYKRNYSDQQVIEATKIINEFKDKIRAPQYDIIIDNPWETDEDLVKTLMFLTKLPSPYSLCLFSLTFYPGTELYEKAKQEGIITNDLEDVYRKYYHSCKKTYLNRLFFLLNKSRGRISTKVMSLLTNKTLRKLKFNWIPYIIIFLCEYLLYEGLKDIRKGDCSRIIRYIRSISERKKNLGKGISVSF
jgi:radical SAM superfamily enzyme YgiQ (UPF0313 family)